MSSQTNSQNQDPSSSAKDANLTTHDQQQLQQQLEEQQNPPLSHDPQSPKTLTLEIPASDDPNPRDPPADDPNQEDPEESAPFSPTISDSHVSSATTASSFFRRGGGGGRRKKRRAVPVKKKRLEILKGTLNPVPFAPVKALDFSSHEALLRRLGLWDFVHLQFDDNLRTDLIAQLIANFNPGSRCSHVNDVRIKVSRPDLARALQLPVKKDEIDNALEVRETEESIGFMDEFVSTWLLLHGDTWMMTGDVLNTIKMIKEGNFEKVDWSNLIWLMVKKELTDTNIGNCYYASHLQLLMKRQKHELFKEEPVKTEIDVKDDEEEEEVKTNEELHGGSELEEHNIELSLGGLDNAVKDNGEKEKKEQLGEDAMDFEESKEDEEQGQWVNNSMDGHFLQRCNLGEVGAVECEEERKQEAEDEEGEGEEGEDGEEEEEEVGFRVSPKGDGLEGASSENLISSMETAQIPFSSRVQIRDNVPSGDFLASRADTQTMPGGSSLFSNGSGSKREFEHLENDMPHHALNGGYKRMRSDEHWDMKSASNFGMCLEQMQHFMGKARMFYEEKEQAFEELNMQQQLLINGLEQRTNIIHNLQKLKVEEQQKRQMENYRLERELYMMGNLLEGYRKALKETTKAFAEYRKKFPSPEEPIYKDTGSGGLVLSAAELEKQRLKREEEDKQNQLLIEKKLKELEADCITKFEAYKDRVELLDNKLLHVKKEVNLFKEVVAKRKVPEMSEYAPSEE